MGGQAGASRRKLCSWWEMRQWEILTRPPTLAVGSPLVLNPLLVSAPFACKPLKVIQAPRVDPVLGEVGLEIEAGIFAIGPICPYILVMKDKRFELRLTGVEYERLRGRAERSGVTVTWLIREMLGLEKGNRRRGHGDGKGEGVAAASAGGRVEDVRESAGGDQGRVAVLSGGELRSGAGGSASSEAVGGAVSSGTASKHWAANLMPAPVIKASLLCERCTRVGRASCAECRKR
jgi:hypothetical protein